MTQRIKFGTDGWRGVMCDDFTNQTVAYAAQGIADYMASRSRDPLAVIGYDCRFASEVFAQLVAEVLAANGVPSLLFDRPTPTQVASWTVIDQHATGAAVITASHNPWLFNGVKYKPETGSSAPTEVIAALEDRINDIAIAGPAAVKRISPGTYSDHPLIRAYDPKPAYYEQVAKMLDLPALRGAGLKILHENMYGAGFDYIKELLGGASTAVTELHAERNPYFGGVSPEPIPQNLAGSLARMGEGGFDLCICTDGDADRVGIIDETGRFITQLQVYALLMVYLFEVRGWRGPVVKTINMTSMADKLAAQFGVDVYELPVGFKNVAPKMMETDALLGGEESGGFGFKGHIPERDGVLAGLFFADMIMRTGKPLGQLLADLEARVGPHAYARHDIHFNREAFAAERERILTALADHTPTEVAGERVVNVRADDGYKFFLADGSWVLVRLSGTEPLMRVYAEASDAEKVEGRLLAMEDLVGVGRVVA
ncbi:MAG TPA: phosphoglucomutase/phosphomannomutase family protein [Candidatus Dormibacteraeota bacterium]|jgi:alpha-D-glucose phosphate-specific phosphoglucomutase|nr:phosphoglucomutase/phosphomannomutase family protein [Candidatus Dormibacteraeota bacterium]